MLKYLLITLMLLLNLKASTIVKKTYYVDSNSVKLSDIFPDIKNDRVIYTFAQGKHSKRVRFSQLKKVLLSNGIKKFKSENAYVRFVQNSPIDTSKIKELIKKAYQEHYKHIYIKSVDIHSRGYIQKIPEKYSIKIQGRSYLRNKGIVIVQSSAHRDTFFDYFIDAKVDVYKTRKDVKRNVELSLINTKKEIISLDNFKDVPIQDIQNSTVQSKYNIKKGTILTSRDIEKLYLVRRGSSVNIFLDSSNLSISMFAKATQNGCLGDTISVVKSNGKKIKVIVTAKHTAEVR